MNEQCQDIELLQRFTRQGEESAFADVVRRHLDLVYTTALRKVTDHGAAQEVAQNVFAALARKAWRFAPDDCLPAWLHKAALLESKSWLRGELAKRRREQTAAELGMTMNPSEDQHAFRALVPLLDEALLSLREKDRTALLLRYYETRSLREVGAAFGVSEDTARKRVQTALERLSEFFKRHGFRTVSMAAAAAALQHTATSASATVASSVVNAALQAGPPALAGLTTWLARLASLSRARTAAACLAVAILPLGWQLQQRHLAAEELKRIEARFLSIRTESAALETELERVRANSEKLERSLAQQKEAAARAAASAQAFESWKKKVRGLLTAPDYQWSDDSPFVRIPKAALPELCKRSQPEPFWSPGVVRPYARELLGLTGAERQSVEAALHEHFLALERAAFLIETNKPLSGSAVAARKFILLPPPEDERDRHAKQLLAGLSSVLGEERWPLVEPRLKEQNVLPNILALNKRQGAQEVEVSVAANDQGRLGWNWTGGNGGIVGYANGNLSMFLPEGDPHRTTGSERFGEGFSEPMRQRMTVWLQEQARARLGKEGGP
jgi:RNA polymerase sigma factor (sigma-70 family)